MSRDYYDDDDSFDLTASLRQQVNNQMEEDRRERHMSNSKRQTKTSQKGKRRKKKKKYKVLKIFLAFVLILSAIAGYLILTKSGRKVLVKVASMYISSGVQHDDSTPEAVEWFNGRNVGRKEDYVTNILLIGIEEFGGARNTDSMMIASINSNKNTVQLTSLMRDSYVSVPGWKKTKLNAAYAHGGIELLRDTIEENYLIHLDGYASVDFKSFEEIIDILGGVDVQLGESEAKYLRTTNYISNKKYRKDIHEGMNTLNGNQALGYCRVRKRPTYDGVNNDQGRTLRQRRVLNAIFDKYKQQDPISLITTTNKCMSYVTTSLSSGQIETLLGTMVENRITNMEQVRIPVDGAYQSPKAYEGVTWPIVLDWDTNIKEMYKTIYGDTEEQAAEKLLQMRGGMR